MTAPPDEDEMDCFCKAAEEGLLGEVWNAARDLAMYGRSAVLSGGQDS